MTMKKKPEFGEISSEEFNIGDLVEWSIWNTIQEEWSLKYGIVSDIKNEIRGNRLVSVSKVIPLNESSTEIEFFTLSLRLVSRSMVSMVKKSNFLIFQNYLRYIYHARSS